MGRALIQEMRGRYRPDRLSVLWGRAARESPAERFAREVILRWEEEGERLWSLLVERARLAAEEDGDEDDTGRPRHIREVAPERGKPGILPPDGTGDDAPPEHEDRVFAARAGAGGLDGAGRVRGPGARPEDDPPGRGAALSRPPAVPTSRRVLGGAGARAAPPPARALAGRKEPGGAAEESRGAAGASVRGSPPGGGPRGLPPRALRLAGSTSRRPEPDSPAALRGAARSALRDDAAPGAGAGGRPEPGASRASPGVEGNGRRAARDAPPAARDVVEALLEARVRREEALREWAGTGF